MCPSRISFPHCQNAPNSVFSVCTPLCPSVVSFPHCQSASNLICSVSPACPSALSAPNCQSTKPSFVRVDACVPVSLQFPKLRKCLKFGVFNVHACFCPCSPGNMRRTDWGLRPYTVQTVSARWRIILVPFVKKVHHQPSRSHFYYSEYLSRKFIIISRSSALAISSTSRRSSTARKVNAEIQPQQRIQHTLL